MEWILVAIIVFAIYNAERLPEIISKIKKDVPHIVEAGKKVSKDLQKKAQETKKGKTAIKETSKEKSSDN